MQGGSLLQKELYDGIFNLQRSLDSYARGLKHLLHDDALAESLFTCFVCRGNPGLLRPPSHGGMHLI